MPQITEYNASPAPNATMSNASDKVQAATGVLAGVANSLDTLGTQITQHAERVDNTNATLQHSNVEAAGKIKWNEMMQSGEAADPEKVKAFTDQLSSQFDNITENMHTTKGKDNAQTAINQAKNDFAVTIAAGHSTAQGEEAAASNTKSVANFSLGIAADPHSFDTTTTTYTTQANNLPGLGPKEKGILIKEATQQFARAAVVGLIEKKDFNGARDFLSSGKANNVLDATQQDQLENQINSRESAQGTAERLAEAAQERAKKEASNTALNKHISNFSSTNADNPAANIDAINHDDNLTPADKGEAIRLMEVEDTMRGAPERAARAAATAGREAQAAARAEAERAQVEGDKKAAVDVMSRINATAGDPTAITDPKEIYSEVKEGGLTVTRANTLVTALNTVNESKKKGDGYAAQYAEFHKSSRQDITNGFASREGNYASFVDYTEPLIQKGLQQGLTAGQMFDKDSKDYVGKGYKAPAVGLDNFDHDETPANTKKAPAFATSTLDKMKREEGVAALYAAVKAGGISPQAATREAHTRWPQGAK